MLTLPRSSNAGPVISSCNCGPLPLSMLTRSNLCGPGSASMPCWHRLKQPRSSNSLIYGLHCLSLLKQRCSSNRLSSGMNRLRLHRFSLNRLEGLHSQIKLL